MKDLFRFKKHFTATIWIWMVYSCVEDQNALKEHRLMGEAFGTTYHFTYFSKESDSRLEFQIDSVIKAVNNSMSTYIPTSDISRINKGDTTVITDKMFQEVFKLSTEVYKRTSGYFDPTVGALVNAYGFGPGRALLPDRIRLDSLKNLVGWDKVSLSDSGTVLKSKAEIQIDFNAIAKGYAIDRMAIVFDQKNIQYYLLEVGGEIVAKGIHPLKNKPWTIGVDDPQNLEERGAAALIGISDLALAASGNYRKFFIDSITGQKYVHSINPKTGLPKISNILATTVTAPNCATADAYATAFMVMELEQSQELLADSNNLEAMIIYSNENGETVQFKTKGFDKLILKD